MGRRIRGDGQVPEEESQRGSGRGAPSGGEPAVATIVGVDGPHLLAAANGNAESSAVAIPSFEVLTEKGLLEIPNDPCADRPTLLEAISADQQLSFAVRWAPVQSTSGSSIANMLGSQGINVTFLLPIDSAVPAGLFRWLGVAGLNISNGTTDAHRLASIYLFVNEKLSLDQLLSVPSFNTVLGIIKKEDFVVKFTDDEAGDVFVEGLAPNNVGKIIGKIDACNGVVYKMDTMLLPSNTSTDIFKGPEDAVITIPIWVDRSARCPLTVPQVVDGYASDWVGILEPTGLKDLISDKLSATIFASVNQGLADAADDAKSSDAILYNMLVGQWCPEELKSMGTMNSMLGNVTGENLPLQFSDDNGILVITGELGSARVLNITSACQSLIFITDVPLAAPKRASPAVAPAVLPSLPNRHLTCIQPEYLRASTSSSSSTSSDTLSDDSSSSNVGLIVGITVGVVCAAALAAGLLFYVLHRRAINGPTNSVNNNNNLDPGLQRNLSGDVQLLSADGAILDFNNTGTGSGTNGMRPSSFGTIPASSLFSSLIASSDGFHHTAKVAPPFFAVEEEEFPRAGSTPKISRILSGGGLSQLTRLASTDSSLDLWEIDANDVEINVDEKGKPIELGRGSFGAVYRGTLRGVQTAAIKVLNASVGSDAEAAFQREAAILKHVNRDRNVVQLYGTSKMPDGKLLLVTELMEGGDLRCALNNPETTETLQWHHNGKRVALDIARGLTALHAVHVVHRDLKSKNVLLADNLAAKIADVGIAAVHSQGYLTASAGQVVGTLAWSAPELILGQLCTEKVDIYSYGIVLWEIATGNVPWRGFTRLPPPSERCPEELAALVHDCTHEDPKQRPSAKEVYDKILLIPPVFTN